MENEVFSERLCMERHKNIELLLNKVDKNIESLYARLNWFYVIVITALVGAVSAIGVSCSKFGN